MVDFATERNCLKAATCARGHVRLFNARATRAAEPHGCQQKETDQPHKESNNLATIILDMRHVAGYGSG
jgi:hypothetical protein